MDITVNIKIDITSTTDIYSETILPELTEDKSTGNINTLKFGNFQIKYKIMH
jgi:hypothetical protein